MLVRCRPVRPILPVPRGRSLQICSGHAPERPNKVSGVSVGVDLVENDSVDREGALHRLRRRHGAMSHLRAPRCSSHCLCMIIMKLRGRRSVPLDPHADLGRARACRRVRVRLPRRTRLHARCLRRGAWSARHGARWARGAEGGGDTSWRVDRHAVTRACAAVSFCHPPVRSIRSIDPHAQ